MFRRYKAWHSLTLYLDRSEADIRQFAAFVETLNGENRAVAASKTLTLSAHLLAARDLVGAIVDVPASGLNPTIIDAELACLEFTDAIDDAFEAIRRLTKHELRLPDGTSIHHLLV